MTRRPVNPRAGLRVGPRSPLMLVGWRRAPSPGVASAVRSLYASGCWTQSQLADAYALSVGTVSKIIRTDPALTRRGTRP